MAKGWPNPPSVLFPWYERANCIDRRERQLAEITQRRRGYHLILIFEGSICLAAAEKWQLPGNYSDFYQRPRLNSTLTNPRTISWLISYRLNDPKGGTK